MTFWRNGGLSLCERGLEHGRYSGELDCSWGGVGIEAGPKRLEESILTGAYVHMFGIEAERLRAD